MRFNIIFLTLFSFALAFAQTGTYLKAPALIEGFTTITSAAGTTNLTRASETKQIVTGSTTQTIVLPDATTMSKELGRRFYIINKSSGTVTVNANGGGLLATVASGTQVEVHLRAAGSAAGTWDTLASSGGGGGGTWGSITGTLSSQTDLQSALDLKAPLANPTFTGTIGTPLITSKAVVTNGSGQLAASATSSTQIGYLSNITQDLQTSLDAKTDESVLTTKGDTYVATASATLTRQAAGADGTLPIYDSLTTTGIRAGIPVGVQNYAKGNPSAEANSVTGWITYADAAAVAPVDCTGGSPNSTWTASATSPMHGTYQFLMTHNTGATRQGEGASYAFTIDSGDQAKVMQVEFDYKVTGGTFVAGSGTDYTSAGDSTNTVWIYDVTNAVMIQPTTYRLYSSSTNTTKFVTNFQTASNSTSYRLCIHKGTSATVSGSAITVAYDDVLITPSKYVYGTPISDWVAWTPTFTGFGTVTGVNFQSRRVADELEVRGTFTTGTTTATEARISLGHAGVNSNVTTKSTLPTLQLVGAMKQGAALSTTDFQDRQVYAEASKSYVTFGASYSTYSSGLLKGNGNGVAASTTTQSLYFSVPVQGWSSNTQVSDGYDSRKIIFEARTNPGAIATSAATYVTLTWSAVNVDHVAGWNGTDTYTIKTADCYDIQVLANQNSAAAAYLDVAYRINGGSEVLIGRGFGSATAAAVTTGTATVCLNSGDTVQARAQTEGTQGIGSLRRFTIKRSGGGTPTTTATELVAVSINGSTTTAAGAVTTISWLNKTTDTHGAFNSNEFIVPVSGWYIVDLNVRHNGGAGLAVNQVSLGYIQVDTGGGYSTVRQGFKFVESTGVASFSHHAHYEDYLKAGTKIRFQHETTIGTPTISVSGQDTYASIVRK